MKKMIIGLCLGFLIGVICRLINIPVPAPPALTGVFIVMSMTVGYTLADQWEKKQETLHD